MKYWMLIIVYCVCIFPSSAQEIFRAVVKDKETGLALPGVSVAPGTGNGLLTNDSGQVVISSLTAGKHTIRFSFVGCETLQLTVVLPDSSWHEILLTPVHTSLEEVTVVASTRNNQRIENSPLKVEVLGKEEMDEE